MKRLLVAIVLLTGTNAHALDAEQRNALSHLGQIFASAMICDAVEINRSLTAAMYIAYSINLGDPEQNRIVETKTRETVVAWRNRDKTAACVAAMTLYGPDGANVPNMLVWK